MLSGIGDADDLRRAGVAPLHDLKGVGKNLQDHLCTNVHVGLREPISYDGQDRFPHSIRHGLQWLLYRSGPVASVIVEGGGFASSDGSGRPDMQIHIAPAFVVRGGQTRLDGHGFTVNTTFLRPRSVGSVALRCLGPRGRTDHRSELPRRSLRSGDVAAFNPNRARDSRRKEIAKYIKEERLPGPDARTDAEIMAYVRQYACCDYHPVGTCKMGADADGGGRFSSPRARPRGPARRRRLDHAGASSGNTNAPTMMIAEKAADLIRNRTHSAAVLEV